ncbi:cobalt ECF transporter T component CbiQ [Clostridium thermosuccinogenes]|jgi:cobalt/nickel transport system permease protein|uniref:Cobalt ECF transporter T component CbiQ n=1 Tax=Clostridium thermosuccinogenes TaxID=84032 RepID=A0A2K2F9Q7_9CLOT|nr:cobalt ECF transporter T component CbiQ [Pseudoclostridium thermosuccinogenes]AUS95655.1 cobalt ECF transporter T component CbiQ [Pseudoclostridium thermosuccinogenes]PNT95532.1 cobalt ECF transporter T component CbiQ [Pseudoclostridium thermosuccinogenes]PNT96635.1 cobalt ECF transporter T component CbiQ [Pseudoclostridium thermosuccinogenes]
MPKVTQSLYEMRFLEELSEGNTAIHRIHPAAKLLVTLLFLTAVVSFGKYEIAGLLPLALYPALIFSLGEIPVKPLLKRCLLAAPFAVGIGILNPVFDSTPMEFAGISIAGGWITFASILIKSGLTVVAALLLIATTGMTKTGLALRMIKVPRLMVLQLLLTYRYISVLMEEVARILRAYSMRAPEQKGIDRSIWGSLLGQLMLRSFDRAERVYQAMHLRGFDGNYYDGSTPKARLVDFLYVILWGSFFATARFVNIPELVGSVIMSWTA